MEIVVGKYSGFCQGVKRAVNIAMENTPCCTWGHLIHNEGVLKTLEEKGVVSVDNIDQIKNRKLIIRSHGVPKSVEESFQNSNIDYIDATCVFVKKIHKIVDEYHRNGYSIIIVGNANHPEVVGINGWCGNSAIIVDECSNIDLDSSKKYCLVAQTTFEEESYKKIIKKLEKYAKIVVINNTICYTTHSRQEEAYLLSKSCDCMFVIGSRTSSNTKQLFDICSKNCENTHYIQALSDVPSQSVANKINKLGVVAGASTPNELIMEVVKQMSESQNTQIEKNNDFGKLLEKSAATTNVKAGKLYKECKVISANEDGITISFGGKKDGFIDKSEAEVDGIEYVPANYKEGDEISAIVIENNGKKNKDCICFSKKANDKRMIEDKKAEEALKGGEFKVTIEASVKGGLTAKMGRYNIFVPASQIRTGYVTDEDLKKYVGKQLRLRVIPGKNEEATEEVKIKRNKTIVASQKIILDEEKKVKDDSLWEVLQEGNIVTGKVKRFAEFGAFVSVNGFDCLAHISDLSYYKIAKPSEVLEIGKSYEFVILKADRATQRVSLGYKQLQKRPYEIALEKYPVGSVITGTVRSVFPYGAFVLIERDVDGLIPVSEIAHTFTKNASDVFKEGDEVTAQVIRFDANRITLSVKALIEKPAVEEEVESSEAYQEAKEKRSQRNAKKFEGNGTSTRKPRAKKDVEDEQVSAWTSEDSDTATMADLFKGLNFDINE